MILLQDYIIFSVLLFAISCVGLVIQRQNIIAILMCVELMLLAVSSLWLAFGHLHQQIDGQIMVFFILAVAAAETAVGLAIIIAMYRLHASVKTEDIASLKG